MDLFSQIEAPEREELLQLRKELEENNYKYYVLNQPSMSDQEFDAKMHRLQDLETRFPDMFDPKSPTQHVGSDLTAKTKGKGCATSNAHPFMVPKVGLEPTRYRYQRILSPSRLPFHHAGK